MFGKSKNNKEVIYYNLDNVPVVNITEERFLLDFSKEQQNFLLDCLNNSSAPYYMDLGNTIAHIAYKGLSVEQMYMIFTAYSQERVLPYDYDRRLSDIRGEGFHKKQEEQYDCFNTSKIYLPVNCLDYMHSHRNMMGEVKERSGAIVNRHDMSMDANILWKVIHTDYDKLVDNIWISPGNGAVLGNLLTTDSNVTMGWAALAARAGIDVFKTLDEINAERSKYIVTCDEDKYMTCPIQLDAVEIRDMILCRFFDEDYKDYLIKRFNYFAGDYARFIFDVERDDGNPDSPTNGRVIYHAMERFYFPTFDIIEAVVKKYQVNKNTKLYITNNLDGSGGYQRAFYDFTESVIQKAVAIKTAHDMGYSTLDHRFVLRKTIT